MITFQCEKALLQNAISLTSRAASAKSSIPALEGLLLQADADGASLSGYNMSTGIRSAFPAEVRDAGRVVVPTRLFGDIVRRMPDDMVSVSVNDNLVARMTCGDADFEISALDAADFPDLPVVEDDSPSLSIRQSLFREMIDQTVFSVSTNESRPIHTGALFETENNRLTVVAVDGFRLALRREELISANDAMSFVAPGAALNEVKNICADTDDPATITLGKRHILFEIGDTELICRRLEGEFLNYRTAIPRDNPIAVTVECRDLLRSLDRVSVVISEKLKAPVRCRFENNRVLLSAKTGAGEARDVCPIDGDGQTLEIGFNNRYLTDALRHAPADAVQIRLNTGVSPAVILPTEGDEKFLYMVLPVRLRA